jgi:hypothetical protein
MKTETPARMRISFSAGRLLMCTSHVMTTQRRSAATGSHVSSGVPRSKWSMISSTRALCARAVRRVRLAVPPRQCSRRGRSRARTPAG